MGSGFNPYIVFDCSLLSDRPHAASQTVFQPVKKASKAVCDEDVLLKKEVTIDSIEHAQAYLWIQIP